MWIRPMDGESFMGPINIILVLYIRGVEKRDRYEGLRAGRNRGFIPLAKTSAEIPVGPAVPH